MARRNLASVFRMTLWTLLIAGTIAAAVGIYYLRRAGPYVPPSKARLDPGMVDALIQRTMAELERSPEFQAHAKAYEQRARTISREIEEQVTPDMTTEEIERLVSSKMAALRQDPVAAQRQV